MKESGISGNDESRGRVRLGLFLVFILALALRLAAIFYLHNFDTVTGYENEEVARNLLDGHGWSMSHFGSRQPTAFMYPLYTFFLYFHFRVFGVDFMPVEVTQAIIGSLSSVLLFFLGARLFDRRVGWLAAFASAGYPIYVYWCARGQALIIEIFLLELMILVWLVAMERRKLFLYGVFGVLLGVSGLSRTLYLAFLPLFLIWFWYWKGAGVRELFKASAVPIIFCAVVIGPWTSRNYIVFKKFIPVTINNGYNLWVGNNPNATGDMFTKDGQGMWETVPEDMRDRLAGMDEVGKDALFQREAIGFIRENPKMFLRLVPSKLLFLWWFSPHMPTDFPGFREFVYLALLLPALVGMFLSRRNFRAVSIFYMIYIELSFIYSIYFSMARFRYLIEFSFILFAAASVLWIYERFRNIRE